MRMGAKAKCLAVIAGNAATIVPTGPVDAIMLRLPNVPSTERPTLMTAWMGVPNSWIGRGATKAGLALTTSDVLGVTFQSRLL